jgi:hypothetical protein
MKTDPFTDSFWLLLGQTGYDEPLSWGRWVMVALLLILLTDSVAIARANWSADPAQRTAGDLWTLLFRVLLGAMCSRVRCGSCLCRMQEACNTGPGRWQNMPRSRSTGDPVGQHVGDGRPAAARGRGGAYRSRPGLHDLANALASVGDRDAAFPLPHGRGDEFHHGSPGHDPRDLTPRGVKPRDIYVRDLSLEAIKVRPRNFR